MIVGMMRDRQIYVRTTDAAYKWVAEQAEVLGYSHGAVVSVVLEMAARQGWLLELPQVTVAEAAEFVRREGGVPGSGPVERPARKTRAKRPRAQPEARAGGPVTDGALALDDQPEPGLIERLDAVLKGGEVPQQGGCKHPGVGFKQRCRKCGSYNMRKP
jgi:hypothetical protein